MKIKNKKVMQNKNKRKIFFQNKQKNQKIKVLLI